MQTLRLVSCALGAILFQSTHADASCPTKDTGTLQQIVQNFATEKVTAGNVWGLCAIAVDKYGHQGIACAGTSDGVHPLNASSIFQIGSMTKTVTAALFARRVAEGKVGIAMSAFHAPNELLDPQIPFQYRRFSGNPITLIDLATHHAGMPENPGVYNGANGDYLKLDNLLDAYNQGFPSKIGAHIYDYSNFGFQLLGYAMSNIDGYGSDWFSDARQNVLSPNLMPSTRTYEAWQAESPTTFTTNAVHGHQASPSWSDVGTDPSSRCPTADPSGCLYSTSNDMRNWLQYAMGLRTPSPVLAQARSLMRQAYDDTDDAEANMGIGWRLADEAAYACHVVPRTTRPYTRAAKSGDITGQHSWIEFLQDPADPTGTSPLGIVLMVNSEPNGSFKIGKDGLGQELLSRIPLP